ncbi:MAG TPA: T9SS type A sorting domain-containing protein [Flavipsychrobacter sp.]|nr:T9SS type A sorting domain-containing protein [Flavipsychrobacter sp.]
MKQVLKAAFLLGYLFVGAAGVIAQNVVQAEYFFDSDPGFGSGTQVTISTPAANISALSFNASVSSLSNGIHTMYIRTKDANGRWSQTFAHTMAKVQPVFSNPHSLSNISHAEYFIDTDPGFGNGTAITLSSATNISSLLINVNVASINTGLHTLYIRTKDANGWSVVANMPFAKVQNPFGNPNSITNITKLEYFFDSDPGFGNGTDVPVSANTNISGFTFNANVTALSQGLHTLYLRSKDAQGKWTMVHSMPFAKVQMPFANPNSISNIVKMEYFYDYDPGFGNGVDVPVTANATINNFSFNTSVSSLSSGLHTLYVRTKDAQGKWSVTFSQQFSRIQGISGNPAQISKINKAEYFFNSDPGHGNGTNIPLTAATTISNLSFNADVSTLPNGMHTMYVRTRDSLGQWSISNNMIFAKVQPVSGNPNTTSNVVKLEYFYDVDPGFGNGTDVPVVASSNISSFAFTANVSSLTNGMHTLYVRSKDAQGKWSVTNATVFTKVQALSINPNTRTNISRIEYFVDIDPGIGNAFPLTFTPDTNVSTLAFNVDMTVLLNGPHKLYIRSRDAQGKWSITNIHEFNGGTAPLSIKLLSFEAKLQQDKQVMLEWITEQEKDVARYIIERSYDATDWKYLSEKQPVTNSSNERRVYQLVDKQPGTGIVYYRLTEVDLNGKKTQAPIRFVKITAEPNSLASVYPNPNNGKRATISSSIFSEGEVTLKIIGVDGKIYQSQIINEPNAETFTITDLQLAAGNYYINLQSKNKTESLKLIVTADPF